MNERRSLVHIILASVLCAVLALGFSMGEASAEYDIRGEAYDLRPFVTGETDAEYDSESGAYLITGADPSLTLERLDRQMAGLILRIQEEAEKDIPVTVYWTRAEGVPFVGALSDTSVIKKGEQKAKLSLPDYSVSALRVDIDGDCTLAAIDTTEGAIRRNRSYGTAFWVSFFIRFLLLLVVVLPLVSALKGRSAKEILCGAPKKNYHGEIDLLRILATVFVIASHTLNDTLMPTVARGDPGYAFFKLVPSVTLCCNVIYVLISGALLLAPSETAQGGDRSLRDESGVSIKAFYKRRLTRVVLPMLCYYAFYVIQGHPREVFRDGIAAGLRRILEGLFAGRSQVVPHFWLVYVIIGLYIIAPFLRILVARLSEGQLFTLIALIFAADVCTTYLPFFGFWFGIEVSISAWAGVFLLGYYLTTEQAKKRRPYFLAAGALGILCSFLTQYFFPERIESAATNAPLMWLVGAGFFVLVSLLTERLNEGAKKKGFDVWRSSVVQSLSKYSYGMLLVHMLFISKYVLPIGWRMEAEHGHLKLYMLLMILVTFVISYLFAVVYDNTAVAFAQHIFLQPHKASKENGSARRDQEI